MEMDDWDCQLVLASEGVVVLASEIDLLIGSVSTEYRAIDRVRDAYLKSCTTSTKSSVIPAPSSWQD